MPPDEPDLRTLEVRGWLARASEDLRAGRHDLTALPPLANDAAFHAQQCAEKAMKALLVHGERPFRKTHNLTELGAAASKIAPDLVEVLREASLLTEFAWRFRYPGGGTGIADSDASRALGVAERTLNAVLEALPPECRRLGREPG